MSKNFLEMNLEVKTGNLSFLSYINFSHITQSRKESKDKRIANVNPAKRKGRLVQWIQDPDSQEVLHQQRKRLEFPTPQKQPHLQRSVF